MMRKLMLLVLVGLGLTCLPLMAQPGGDVRIIPRPQQAALTSTSSHALTEGHAIHAPAALAAEADYLAEELAARGLNLKVRHRGRAAIGVVLKLCDTLASPEAYRLDIGSHRVTIAGSTPAGVFYGIQSLLQLLDNAPQAGATLPVGTLTDAPRYAWRGFMLDEARHFFGREKVLQLLDLMARYKLNRLHWHLTDEQGWRIEIRRYPRLAAEGGRGDWSHMGQGPARYYTQDDIRDIVAYATRRHIEIIPEIDMPGHATAANRAYPEYSGGGTKAHPEFTFNVGKDSTYTYLTDILHEVGGLFPSRYLHLGGDEVAYGIDAWRTAPHVQALIEREGLADVKQAEAYFMHRMTDSVRTLDKTMAGWDELLDHRPDTASTLIFWWRHDRTAQLRKSLAGGYRTVLCPRRPLYFDFIQHASHKWGRVWSGFCPVEDVYAFPDPLLDKCGFSDAERSHIVGLQANLWTERVQNTERLDFMTWPRLCALAEAAWTQPGRKDFADFSRRLDDAYRLFDRLGVYYFDTRDPQRHPEPRGAEQAGKDTPMDFRD